MVYSYRDLTVWQKAMDLVVEVYRIVRLLPKEETYGLSDQMRRAAVSIPSNIAEGKMRNTRREYINFLYMARGSNAELQTQCYICARVHYFAEEELIEVLSLSDEVGRMINALILSLTKPNP